MIAEIIVKEEGRNWVELVGVTDEKSERQLAAGNGAAIGLRADYIEHCGG
jgi:hypothetical protein